MEFIVTCKCGHVTRGYYMPIDFPVNAENGREAAAIARFIPRVKHDHKDAILNVRKVDHKDYLKQEELNHNNPYLLCRSRKEQNKIEGLKELLCVDNHNKSFKHKTRNSSYLSKRQDELTRSYENQIFDYLNSREYEEFWGY